MGLSQAQFATKLSRISLTPDTRHLTLDHPAPDPPDTRHLAPRHPKHPEAVEDVLGKAGLRPYPLAAGPGSAKAKVILRGLSRFFSSPA